MQFVRNMLAEQRKRMVGTLMQHIEREVYPHLDPSSQVRLRKVVLSSTSAYHDMCLDMLKASVSDGTVINDEAARLLARLNNEVQQMHATLQGNPDAVRG